MTCILYTDPQKSIQPIRLNAYELSPFFMKNNAASSKTHTHTHLILFFMLYLTNRVASENQNYES